MSKVLVDRELLEIIEQLLDILPESKTIRTVRELLAQPAEAEGVVIKIECTTCRGTGSLEFEGGAVVKDCAPCKGTGRDLKAERYALAARLAETIAALSAVTAERDRLRDDADRWNWYAPRVAAQVGESLVQMNATVDAAMAAKEA